jgi:hypothetical protein
MAARSFAAGLKKGGTLVIDYLNIDYIAPRLVAEETVIRSGITFHINRRIEGKKIIKDIRFIDKEGNDRHYTEQVAAFDQSDFINLFKDAGLQLTGTFGNYKLGNFDPLTSPRLIMIFKK